MEQVEVDGGFLSANQNNGISDEFYDWWHSFIRGEKKIENQFNSKIEIVDLFCGAGGLGLGAQLASSFIEKKAEFRCVIDADTDAVEVYRQNLNVKNALNCSVADLVDYRIRIKNSRATFAYEPSVINNVLAQSQGVDLLIAGPPCQGHSNLNNFTRRNDPRNDLYVATAAIAVALDVKGVVIENVPTVQSAYGDVVKIAKEILENSGYRVGKKILKMNQLGGAQTRSRHFLIAVKDFGNLEDFQRVIDSSVESLKRPEKSVLWAIRDLEDKLGQSVFDSVPKGSSETQRRIDWMFENNAYDLDNSERPDCHKNGTTYTAVYGRMHGDKPSPTLTTGIGTPGQGRFIHPERNRLITPHEAARIQCFPDTYNFELSNKTTTRKNLNKWIGDAVPSMLGMYACAIALQQNLGKPLKFPWSI